MGLKAGSTAHRSLRHDRWHFPSLLGFTISQIGDPVIHPSNRVANRKTADKSIEKADKAAQKRDPITDEELPEKRQMTSNRLAAFEHESVGGDEQPQA